MKFKPYLAIDTETTSLDPKTGKILQLAAVYDDGFSPIEELKSFNWFIDWQGDQVTIDNYALSMNCWILEGIAKRKIITYSKIDHAIAIFNKFTNEIFIANQKITVAGKNVAGFDVPFLDSNGFKWSLNRFSHKVIDVGSLYLPDFGYVPSLDEVNKLIGRQKVSHNALDDCYDVVYAIRHKLQIGV